MNYAVKSLRQLNDNIWRESYNGKEHARHMTWDEWNLVLHLVIGGQLPCTISRRFYEQFSFHVYEPQQYPGLEAEMILQVDPWHLWIDDAYSRNSNDIKRFCSCYAIANSERNLEMLKVCEIPSPVSAWDVWDYDTLKRYNYVG